MRSRYGKTRFTWPVHSPVLPLAAGGADLAGRVCSRRRGSAQPRTTAFTEDDFEAFESRLEAHWGGLLLELPGFIEELLAGKWIASADRHAPTDVIGDFGEFLAADAFLAERAPGGIVTRVLRPPGMPRPDFLVFDPGQNRLTALECKAGSVNASKLRVEISRKGPGKARALNVCANVIRRKQSGLRQVDPSVVRISGRGLGPTVATPCVLQSRVIANQTAVVTPYFVDGRIANGTYIQADRLTVPKRCGISCADCLVRDGHATVVAPIFMNDETRVVPLQPDEQGVAEFFSCYSAAGRALWVRSADDFKQEVSRAAALLQSWLRFQERPLNYLGVLLDIVATGLEARLLRAADGEALLRDAARSAHQDFEAIVGKAIRQQQADQRTFRRSEEEDRKLGEADELRRWRVGFDDWAERWWSRSEKTTPLGTLTGSVEPGRWFGGALRAVLEEDPRNERTFVIQGKKGKVVVYRNRPDEYVLR